MFYSVLLAPPRRIAGRRAATPAPAGCPSRALFWIAIGPFLLLGPAKGADLLPPRLYQLTIETGMPHLEENLRYAITHDHLCLGHEQLSTAFPVLHHVALQGCRLDQETWEGETVTAVLTCEGGHGTTGTARWQLGKVAIVGTLEVKLGGKNMTFYQRVTGTPIGDCPPPSHEPTD
jgi:hypothetical protein